MSHDDHPNLDYLEDEKQPSLEDSMQEYLISLQKLANALQKHTDGANKVLGEIEAQIEKVEAQL